MATWQGINLPVDAPAIGTLVRPMLWGSVKAVIIEVQPAYSSCDIPEDAADLYCCVVQEYKPNGKPLGKPYIPLSTDIVIL